MRLRENIRPPERFDHEQLDTPSSATFRSRRAPRYIDYNPNLPPAAFPTLDRPYPTQSSNNGPGGVAAGGNGEDSEVQPDDISDSLDDSDDQVEGTSEKLDDVSIDCLENLIASNGDLNPVYVNNMAIMANAGQKSSSDLDMEDSDLDEEMTDGDIQGTESVNFIREPEWSDLSPKMKVEIVMNMSEHCSWSAVYRKLSLSAEEFEQLQEYIEDRADQDELEDLELSVMREKQLRALLRIDNSSEKRNRIPHKLVFRRISRQTTRRIRESMGTDYYVCEAGEVLNARKFLEKRGLDRAYAGNWTSNIVTMHASQGSQEGFKPVMVQRQNRSIVTEPLTPMTFRPILALERGIRSANHKRLDSTCSALRMSYEGAAPRSNNSGGIQSQRQGEDAPARTLVCLGPGSKRLVVRLKIGRLRAALVHEWEQFVHPRRLVRSFPPIDIFFMPPHRIEQRDGSTGMASSSNIATSQSALDEFAQSLRGAINEDRALRPLGLDQTSLLASWINLRQRLGRPGFDISTRERVAEWRMGMFYRGGSNPTYAGWGSNNTYVTPSRSAPLRLGGFYEEDDNVAPPNGTMAPRNTSVVDSPGSNIWEGFPDPEGNYSPMTPTSVVTSVEMFNDEPMDNTDGSEDEDEEDEEDEVVLVPATRPKTPVH